MLIYGELNSSSHTRMWPLMMTSPVPFAGSRPPRPPWWYLLNFLVHQSGPSNTMDTSALIMAVPMQQITSMWTMILNILKDHEATLMDTVCTQWQHSVDLYHARHTLLIRSLHVQSVLYNYIAFNTKLFMNKIHTKYFMVICCLSVIVMFREKNEYGLFIIITEIGAVR
jgi:hypothetical protein